MYLSIYGACLSTFFWLLFFHVYNISVEQWSPYIYTSGCPWPSATVKSLGFSFLPIDSAGFLSGSVLNDRRTFGCCCSHLSFPTHLWNFRLRRVLHYIHFCPGAASHTVIVILPKWQITLVFFFKCFFFIFLYQNLWEILNPAPHKINISQIYIRKTQKKIPNFSQILCRKNGDTPYKL
jgi:hypothetical protein